MRGLGLAEICDIIINIAGCTGGNGLEKFERIMEIFLKWLSCH